MYEKSFVITFEKAKEQIEVLEGKLVIKFPDDEVYLNTELEGDRLEFYSKKDAIPLVAVSFSNSQRLGGLLQEVDVSFVSLCNRSVNVQVVAKVEKTNSYGISGFFNTIVNLFRNKRFRVFRVEENKIQKSSHTANLGSENVTIKTLENDPVCGIEVDDLVHCVSFTGEKINAKMLVVVGSNEQLEDGGRVEKAKCNVSVERDLLILPNSSVNTSASFMLLPRKFSLVGEARTINRKFGCIFSFSSVLVCLFWLLQFMERFVKNRAVCVFLLLIFIRFFKIYVVLFITFLIVKIQSFFKKSYINLMGLNDVVLFSRILDFLSPVFSLIVIIISFKAVSLYSNVYPKIFWIQDLAKPDDFFIFRFNKHIGFSGLNVVFIVVSLLANYYENKQLNLNAIATSTLGLLFICLILNNIGTAAYVFLNIIITRLFAILQTEQNNLVKRRINQGF